MSTVQKIELTVSSKGQVTIPKSIREDLKVLDGGKLNLVIDSAGKYGLESAELAKGRFISDSEFENLFSSVTKDYDEVFKNLVDL
jgi:AbrB family looped-hinge helix DNA binding protein